MGSTWKTDPQYAACSLYSGAALSLRGLDSLRGYGVFRGDIIKAAGAFVRMDAGCVLTFVATEETSFYTGQQVAALRAENAELRGALEQTAFALAQAAIDKAKS